MMEGILRQRSLPTGTSYEWTELAYQERNTGNTAVLYLRAVGAVRVPGAGGAI